MDNTPSIGSFGAIIGGGSPIAQAMARRGYDTSILDQVSPGSANFQPMPMATQPTNNALPPMNQQPSQPPAQPQAMQPVTPPPAMNPETELILKALTERLKHHSNVEKQLLGV